MNQPTLETETRGAVACTDLFDKLESYNFECEAGPLALCEGWRQLKRDYIEAMRLAIHTHVSGTTIGKDSDVCARCGNDLRHVVHRRMSNVQALPQPPETGVADTKSV